MSALANFYVNIAISGNTEIFLNAPVAGGPYNGFCIHFSLHRKVADRDAFDIVRALIEKSDIKWIKPQKSEWIINADEARKSSDYFKKFDWFKGILRIKPELEIEENEIFGKIQQESVWRLYFIGEDILINMSKKVFLSHKGINKNIVEPYNDVLKELGYETWLDKDAMSAGENPDRSILKGFKESCAAIFFITPDYKDDGWLTDEINHALRENREKKDKFKIITLVLKDSNGNLGVIPEPLQQFIYKHPKNDLEGLKEIIKALPIKLPPPTWEI